MFLNSFLNLLKRESRLTCVVVVNCLCDGFLQVGQPDLLSVPSSLPVLHSQFVYHLLSCGAAGKTHSTFRQYKELPQSMMFTPGKWFWLKTFQAKTYIIMTYLDPPLSPVNLPPSVCAFICTWWRCRWPCGSWCQIQHVKDPGRAPGHRWDLRASSPSHQKWRWSGRTPSGSPAPSSSTPPANQRKEI